MEIMQEYVRGIRQEGFVILFPDYQANQIRFESGIVLQILPVARFFNLRMKLPVPLSQERFFALAGEFTLQVLSREPAGNVWVELIQGPYHIENLCMLKSYIGMMSEAASQIRKHCPEKGIKEIEHAEAFRNSDRNLVELSHFRALENYVMSSIITGISNILIVQGRRGVGKSTSLKTIFAKHGLMAFRLKPEGGLDVSELAKNLTAVALKLKESGNGIAVITPVLADFLLSNTATTFIYDPLTRLILEISYSVPVCLITNQSTIHQTFLSGYSRRFYVDGESDESLLAEILARKYTTGYTIYPDKGEGIANPLLSLMKNHAKQLL